MLFYAKEWFLIASSPKQSVTGWAVGTVYNEKSTAKKMNAPSAQDIIQVHVKLHSADVTEFGSLAVELGKVSSWD